MELFLFWLLRASVLMALFYGLYKFFLAHTTFHNVNRFSLICMLLVISVLPLFRFNFILGKKREPLTGAFSTDLSSIPVTEFVVTQPRVEIPWTHILIMLFAIGFLFTFIRYLIGLSQIAVIIRNSEKKMLPDQTVLWVTDKNISPFSWMKYMILSRGELSADNQAVIRHERAHIHFRHSVDMIFFDLFTCIFWFNPFSWLLRREIQSVHEYQADEKVLSEGIDSKQYQLLLIRKSVGEYKFALANNFRQRDLHKRIDMMKKDKTNRRLKWNYAMVLPVLFLAMTALSAPKLNAKAETTENFPGDVGKVTLRAGGGKHPLYIVDEKIVSEAEMQKINAAEIESVSVLKNNSAIGMYGNKGKEGVILITTKKSNRDALSTGTGTMDSLRGDVKDLIRRTQENSAQNLVRILENPPLIIVDGEKMPKDFELKSILPDEIQSMSVLKDKSAIEMYGDEGKNGVIIITKKIPDQNP
ncbi:M56 family metallopeptidase [Proteiniphilum sp. X52]|uniref:M56 family metallopeptidase n=1 Tax=Proteiniphilum sp. X52 TaxID=2382159 RepID=UPI000F0A3574|nr:M56 family metallopeptidase [Proteiniphilum sp. X52]RNC64719.1 M56 family peptidase [Proteiniphilum sp. X52]